MEVHIEEIVSTVRTVDGTSVLAPRTLAEIVRAVLEAVRQREEHDRRVRAEQRITGGVRDEIEGEA